MRALLLLGLVACRTADPLPTCEGDRLFGAPNANTGLDDSACGGTCTCGGQLWSPPAYTAQDLAAWRGAVLQNPPLPVNEDPWAGALPDPPPGDDPVCAVHAEGAGYRLATWPDPATAIAQGGAITHTGGCGRCSPLADLAVYVGTPDLTEPVRACRLDHLFDPEAALDCLIGLGFTVPCAQIWNWNTQRTQAECGPICFEAIDDPYHLPGGSLNACLQCDEDEAGPMFKAIAGRTRRNTGVASSMCRPCEEVRPIEQPREF